MSSLNSSERYILQQALYWLKESKKPENITDYSAGLARGFAVSFSVVVGWNDSISERLSVLEDKVNYPKKKILP